MPKLTAREICMIALIAGLGATVVSIGHAGKPDSSHQAATIVAQPAKTIAAPQMCAARRAPLARIPAYKRYLSQTPVSRHAQRDG